METSTEETHPAEESLDPDHKVNYISVTVVVKSPTTVYQLDIYIYIQQGAQFQIVFLTQRTRNVGEFCTKVSCFNNLNKTLTLRMEKQEQ